MTRTNYGVAACAVTWLVTLSPSLAATILPGIEGTVYSDLDFDNVIDAGEALNGVAIQLYQDDGDGVFEPGTGDTQSGADYVTGADGAYSFNSLLTGSYFVQLPAQNVAGNNIAVQLSGLINPTAASLMIDDFMDLQEVSADTMAPIATSSSTFMPSHVMGGERDMYVELTAGRGDVDMRVNRFNSEVYQYDTTSGVNGKGIITWDGQDGSGNPIPTMGLAGVDLTNGGTDTGILLKLGIDPTGNGEMATIKIFQGGAANSSEAVVAIPVTDGTASSTVFVPFASFVGSANPDNVDAIQLILGGSVKSIDAQFDFIGTVGAKTHDFVVVPEPSSIALALCGCFALLLRRRVR